MTNMKRITISVPKELDDKIFELKKRDEFVRYSYSAIVRMLVFAGLEHSKEK